MSSKTAPLDIFSIGHILFGLILSAMTIIGMRLVIIAFPFIIESSPFLLFAFLWAALIFTAWEILEHSFVKKWVYDKLYGKNVWGEDLSNAVMDVIVAFIPFSIYFFLFFYADVIILVIILILPHLLIPVVLSRGNPKQNMKRFRLD